MGMPRPTGWTIEVGPAPALAAQARHWSPKKRQAFHELAAAAAYRAIDAIQLRRLFKQRRKIWRDGSWIIYFLRSDSHDNRTILVTISHFHFPGPDAPVPPNGGHRALAPLDLMLSVSGGGKRYSIDLVRGVLPRPPSEGQVLTSLDKTNSKRGRLRLLELFHWGRGANIRNADILSDIARANGAIYYSPRAQILGNPGVLGRDAASLDLPQPDSMVAKSHWTSKLLAVFKLGRTAADGHASVSGSANSANMREFIYGSHNSPHVNGSVHSIRLHRTISKTRLHIANNPVRPNGLE